MTVTAQLLRLYLVDQQLRGLTSRLKSSEDYLKEQDRLLKSIEDRHGALASQIRQLEATAHNDETEVNGTETRIAALRERMNNARTSREHSALLEEINTLKVDKGRVEERALESLTKLDTLRQQQREIEAEREERTKVRAVAEKDRAEREAEIKGRVAELEEQRKTALEDVPPSALAVYRERLASGADEVMAPIEEQDRRNMEYTCGSCYTLIPIEQVSILLKRGDITKCPTCQSILYMEDTLREAINTRQKKTRKVGVE